MGTAKRVNQKRKQVAKRVNQKPKQVAREAQNPAKRIGRKYQQAAASQLDVVSQSVGVFHNGFQEVADEMNAYSVRSLENVFHAWQQFLDVRPLRQVNSGFQEIADEMNAYSVRSLENVFHAWQQFIDARPLQQVVEHQMRCAQNAYEAYVTEFSRLGDLYLRLTRQASEPLRQVSRRS